MDGRTPRSKSDRPIINRSLYKPMYPFLAMFLLYHLDVD